MRASRLAVMTMLAGSGIAVLAFVVAIGAPGASAQVRPYTPPTSVSGGGRGAIGALLPSDVEIRAEATERLAKYKPDPVKYPVPRTKWDGKPDFSGVYWSDAIITRPAGPLESLYRPDVREYREAGGTVKGLIDWRNGVETTGLHCWPPSPMSGSMSIITIQLVSSPGFLVMLNEGGGQFRIIPIVGGNERPQGAPHKPSFLGSSVGHWEGETLVVEVTNFNGKPWLGGGRGSQLPQTSSDALRIVERWSRPDGQTFDYEATVEDTKMLTAPWTGPVRRRALLPYDMIQESPCALDSELYARHLEYAAAEAARKKGASVR